MISILLPSRGRSEQFKRMAQSATETSKGPVEIIARFDEDDMDSAAEASACGVQVFTGPRIRNITALWNECFLRCSGNIVMQANDDIVFRTEGWDCIVEQAFGQWPDHIGMVHGDHLGHYDGTQFGPHPFVHRRWVETVGYFIDPVYSSDFGDSGINDLANAIGRRRFIPVVIEHMHFAWNKADVDQTTLDRLKNHEEDNPEALYESRLPDRISAARRLSAAMTPPLDPDIPEGRLRHKYSAGKCPKCKSWSTVRVTTAFVCNACGANA